MIAGLSRLITGCFQSITTMLEKSLEVLNRFLRGILHGIKLALTNPDMAKKAYRNLLGVLDMSTLERIGKEGFVRSLYSRK